VNAKLGSLLALAIGCAPIVGITDTEVEEPARGGAAGSGGSAGSAISAGKGGTSGSGSGTSGSGTSGGTGGKSGGTGGTGPTGGSATGGAGSGGTPTGGAAGSGASSASGGAGSGNLGGNGGAPPSAGSAGLGAGTGGADGCNGETSRCTSSGRETCTAGVWESAPCPLDEPACEAGECTLRGPTMVAVGDYFIDSTEVTVAQYGEFLEAKGDDTSGQASVCAWNDSYYDDTTLDPPNFPMAYVDWCDAAAFCAWAGKRLCGSIGGGPIARSDLFEAGKSQWFRACGGPSGSQHPRPNAVCNANDGFEDVAEVATFPECEGYYDGLFDLEGNVAEWVDSCDGTTGADDLCDLAGGSIFDDPAHCDLTYPDYARNEKAVSFGIRCCSG